MQEEMIREIETARPMFLVFVNVSSSWLIRRNSSRLIFDWYRRYQHEHYETVGIVDILSRDNTVYRWNQECENYTPRSNAWLSVSMRKNR
jgi:hypothetical protein